MDRTTDYDWNADPDDYADSDSNSNAHDDTDPYSNRDTNLMTESLQATGVIGILNALRGFIRDVGTPVTMLVFCGLIYTGVLKSPITTIQGETEQSIREHAQLEQQAQADHRLIAQLVGVMRVMCRNQPGMNSEQRVLCDSHISDESDRVQASSPNMAPIVSEERGRP